LIRSGLYEEASMQSHKNSIGIVTLSSILAVSAAPASAAVYWDGTGTTWNDVASWSTSAIGDTPDPATIPGSGDDVVFGASTVVANQTLSLGAHQSAASIEFNNTAGLTYGMNAGGANRTLTIGSGGISVAAGAGSITIGSSSPGQNISVRVAEDQTWTSNSSTTIRMRNNSAAADSVLTSVTLTANAAGSGSIQSDSLNDGANGALALVVDSTGTGSVLTFGGSYSGGTLIKQGRFVPKGTGTGDVLIGDTTGSANARVSMLDSSTIASNIIAQAGSSGSATLDDNNGGTTTFAGTLTLNRDLIVGNASKTFIFNNTVGGTGLLTKSGNGVVELRGDNTLTGDIFLDAGTLNLSNIATNTVSTGSLLFDVQDTDSNRIYGDATNATALFDGIFKLDLDAVTVDTGLWNLVDTLTLNETFGDNFSVVDANGALTFSESAGLWTSSNGRWSFSEGDGNLTLVIPEPTSIALLGLGFAMIGRRRAR
jgi:fibronectin-binding autotransporter adhesin